MQRTRSLSRLTFSDTIVFLLLSACMLFRYFITTNIVSQIYLLKTSILSFALLVIASLLLFKKHPVLITKNRKYVIILFAIFIVFGLINGIYYNNPSSKTDSVIAAFGLLGYFVGSIMGKLPENTISKLFRMFFLVLIPCVIFRIGRAYFTFFEGVSLIDNGFTDTSRLWPFTLIYISGFLFFLCNVIKYGSKKRITNMMCMLIYLIAVVANFHKPIIFSLLVGIIVLMALFILKINLKAFIYTILLLIFSLYVFSAIMGTARTTQLVEDKFYQKYLKRDYFDAVDSIRVIDGGRLAIWEDGINVGHKNPIGKGLGSLSIFGVPWHNSFIFLFVTFGYTGVVLYIIFLKCILCRSFYNAFRDSSIFHIWLTCSTYSYFTFTLVGVALVLDYPVMYFFMLMGMIKKRKKMIMPNKYKI